MRTLLRDMLRECGATTIELLGTAKEALRAMQGMPVDVVLCGDLDVAQGQNGQQLLEEAKHLELVGPSCIWMMVSADKSPEGIMGSLEFQPDAYLLKPVTINLLQDRLEKISKRKQAFGQINTAVLKKNYRRAVQLCDEQMAYDKVHAIELLQIKGQMLALAGEVDAAQVLFEQVLSIRELPWARTGLGRICYDQRDYEAAIAHFRRCIDFNRLYLDAYDWLAKALQCNGEIKEAEEVLASALKMSPNSTRRQARLGELAYKRGDFAGAEAAFRKSISVGEYSVMKTPDAYVGLAKSCSATGKTAEAHAVLRTLQKQFDSEDALLRAKSTAGMLFRDEKQKDKADALADEVDLMVNRSFTKFDHRASLEAAHFLIATEHTESAVGLLRHLVVNNHDDKPLLAEVQGIFTGAGREQEGTTLIADCQREANELMNTGVLLARGGKLEEAVAAMRSAKTALPGNGRVLLNFVHVALLYLDHFGVDPALINESREALNATRRIVPGDKRISQLAHQIEELEDQFK
ncbi:MAG: tetratricopeptide repeat protein [Burkholderiales bacterium]|nr:tetratricopeptide repeat protein [Burkholderiales bacterium]